MNFRKKINIVYTGAFSFPYGMAGTKRVKNIMFGLKNLGVNQSVCLMRQETEDIDQLDGIFNDIPFIILEPGMYRFRLVTRYIFFLIKFFVYLTTNKRKDCTNILYVYDDLNIINIIPVILSRFIGFKIIFDIVEDCRFAKGNSSRIFHRIRILTSIFFDHFIHFIAHGIIVISTHLLKKYSNYIDKILYIPISVDLNNFSIQHSSLINSSNSLKLFYSGSYGAKDGVLSIIEAFDKISDEYEDIELYLGGKGDSERMSLIDSSINNCKYRERIHKVGYLNENDYYSFICSMDILFAIRTGTDYANAGFPFKLGECLATRKNVIASKISDVGLFLKDKESCLLVQDDNITEIYDSIKYIIDNPQKSKYIANKGYIVAMNSFNYKLQSVDFYNWLSNFI